MPSGLISKKIRGWPNVSARVILHHDVDLEFSSYHRGQQTGGSHWLDLPGLRAAVGRGEVRFGKHDVVTPKLDFPVVIQAAVEAVEDAAVLMFVDNDPIKDLDETLALKEDSRVLYLRLYAQRGM